MNNKLPVFYSFRRCPYAIRARLAIKVSQVQVALREVSLADKPEAMLTASPKGTVPVLVLQDGTVIDESIDIMVWALQQYDPESWLCQDNERLKKMNNLIASNDYEFKIHLDHYKYANRFPEQSIAHYRQQGEHFLQQLENCLSERRFLIGDGVSLADMAIFPFVRQFAFVDRPWFDQSQYLHVQRWLEVFLNADLFQKVMSKQLQWFVGNEITVFGG